MVAGVKVQEVGLGPISAPRGDEWVNKAAFWPRTCIAKRVAAAKRADQQEFCS